MAGKKWLLPVLLVLLPVMAFSETSPRLDSMTVDALAQLGIASSGAGSVTLAKVYSIINEGIEDVSTHWPAVEKNDTVVMFDTAESGPCRQTSQASGLVSGWLGGRGESLLSRCRQTTLPSH